MIEASKGWQKDFLLGSTVYKRAIWINGDGEEEDAYACVVCGDCVPDVTGLNPDYYGNHELLHISQAQCGLIQSPRLSVEQTFATWDAIDDLPERVKWKK